MKRSEINAIIAHAEEAFARTGFALPGFARWSAAEWSRQLAGAATMIRTGLGWDVTDFASGRFGQQGLLLFTLRNGVAGHGGSGNRPYAEKIMISRRDQLTPMHRHAAKTEDIIHRGRPSEEARLAIRLHGMLPDGSLDRTGDVTAHLDGRTRQVEAGGVIHLAAGDSLTLFPGTFHAVWGEGGDVVGGEVSTVNDDRSDNFFAEPFGRFAPVEEDEPIQRLLVTDYADLAGGQPDPLR